MNKNSTSIFRPALAASRSKTGEGDAPPRDRMTYFVERHDLLPVPCRRLLRNLLMKPGAAPVLFRRWLASSRLALLVFFLLITGSALAAKTYSDNGDGTVTDPTTGLTWMRCALGQTFTRNACSGKANTYSYAAATAARGTLSFAGQGDWRLPNIRELTTIVDRTTFDPAIDRMTFPNTTSSRFWSGSPNARNSGSAWYVDFNFGSVSDGHQSRSYPLRLVRGEPSSGASVTLARPMTDYQDHGDGTATHVPTGLMWKRCAEGQTWSGNTCTGTAGAVILDRAIRASRTYDGKSDWRLADVDELLSLVDYTTLAPAINTTIFPGPWRFAWFGSVSGTPDAYEHQSYAWNVDFMNGYADFGHQGYGGYGVRLVRGGRSIDPAVLTVAKSGPGLVSSVLAWIICGSTCTGAYTPGTRVILRATPATSLVGWGGACTGRAATCTVTMDAAKTVTAIFADAAIPATTGAKP